MSNAEIDARTVSTVVTYLAMDAKPAGQPPPRPFMKIAILKAENPPLHFYRYLYDAVGRDYLWVERRLWSDEKLAALLADDRCPLYVLYVGGVPAGMAELDFRREDDGLIAYFGLVPEFVGRRIGPWFLRQTVELAWTRPIARLRVNSCTLDHRKALSTYQRAGFVPYGREEKRILVPTDLPLPETS